MDPLAHIDVDIEVQEILLAASNHDVEKLQRLLRHSVTGSVNVQDPETGFTPLHAAIAACEPDDRPINGLNGQHFRQESGSPRESTHAIEPTTSHNDGEDSAMYNAVTTVRLLLQNGAIWNDVDKNNETAGCIAKRLGLEELYAIMVDAGTRAEMLLSRLDEYSLLKNADAEDDDNEDEDSGMGVNREEQQNAHVGASNTDDNSTAQNTSSLALSNDGYLHSDLSFAPDRILDQDNNGVMMSWEAEIMERTADLLVPRQGLRILNIGHGMGIIDKLFQSKSPVSHHIIEAHPAVLTHIESNGWKEQAGVQIHAGKWQDVLPKLIDEGVQFDAVFYDTFAEDYKTFKSLFEDHLIGILDDNGLWSFFNGLGADRQISADVYKNIVSMDIAESGYEIQWSTMKVPDLTASATWHGVARPYWKLEEYHLPICSFFG